MCKARVSSTVALGRKPMQLHKLEKCPYGCIQKEAKQLLYGELKNQNFWDLYKTLPNGKKSSGTDSLDPPPPSNRQQFECVLRLAIEPPLGTMRNTKTLSRVVKISHKRDKEQQETSKKSRLQYKHC